jgi:hypothetical protein
MVWGRGVRLAAVAGAWIALVAGFGPGVEARDIRLGGERSGQSGGKQLEKLPENYVELPPIVVAIRKDDGGWHHVRISAWLAPSDLAIARIMGGLRTVIVKGAEEELPKTDFDVLQAAHSGSVTAKEIIHSVVEHTLGHPWKGDVLIRTMTAY